MFKKSKYKNLINYVVLTLIGILVFLPLYWLFITAITPEAEITRMPPRIFPQHLTLENFKRVFYAAPISRWFLNSLLITFIVTLYTLFSASMAAYAFARKSFPGNKFLFALVLGSVMIPSQIVMVPLYLMVRQMNLVDSYWAVILPALPQPFAIFMLKQFIQELPVDIEEAARLDGCSDFMIYWRIILPLIKPVLAALAIFVFITEWNSFIWPLVVLNSPDKFTLSVGLATLQEQQVRDYGLLMAGATISAVPIVFIFFSFQRFLMRGLGMGSLRA
ncbi:MAG: carbohydrate ABC transporter permease [Elusimicrobiota bacterium]